MVRAATRRMISLKESSAFFVTGILECQSSLTAKGEEDSADPKEKIQGVRCERGELFLFLYAASHFFLALLVDPGVCLVSHFGKEKEVVSAERIGRFPLVTVFVEP